jgi:hypothetical protein
MTFRNSDVFDLCAGLVLAELYESFPVPTEVRYLTVYESLAQKFPDEGVTEYMKLISIVQNTVLWLEKTGHLWYATATGDHAIGVQLTEKGLRALREIPASINAERMTVGEYLVAAAKEGAKEALKKGIAILFGAVMAQ